MRLYSYRKGALVALFLLLTSCTCPNWTLDKTITFNPCYNSGRLYFYADCCGKDLELELDRGASGLRMYINVFSLEIAPVILDPPQAELVITIEESEYKYLADILQGGQRLLLTDEARDLIIDTLQSNQIVILKAGRYKAAIQPENFSSLYYNLLSIPISD